MNKKRIWIIIVIIVLLLIIKICSKNYQTTYEPSQMPDIVFFNCIDYSETAEDGDVQSAITFYDKNGNHYTSEDSYVCSLNIDELVKEYAAGNLDDKIKFHTTCDVNELFENYQKLCELSKNEEFEIIYPEYGPDVLANRETWYGVYYDKAGRVQSILIHEKNAHGNHQANDERANEIYRWYIGTFQ